MKEGIRYVNSPRRRSRLGMPEPGSNRPWRIRVRAGRHPPPRFDPSRVFITTERAVEVVVPLAGFARPGRPR